MAASYQVLYTLLKYTIAGSSNTITVSVRGTANSC